MMTFIEKASRSLSWESFLSDMQPIGCHPFGNLFWGTLPGKFSGKLSWKPANPGIPFPRNVPAWIIDISSYRIKSCTNHCYCNRCQVDQRDSQYQDCFPRGLNQKHLKEQFKMSLCHVFPFTGFLGNNRYIAFLPKTVSATMSTIAVLLCTKSCKYMLSLQSQN